jgi:hypothetical protein
MLMHRRAGRGTWRTISFVCLASLFIAPSLGAQTVRPVIAEYKEKARGRFDLGNDTDIPLNVVLEAKSFTVSEDGSPAFRPLDKDIHLKLSQMSFRIPPRQTYYVFYEATADKYPAWFVIYATFAGLSKQSGLNVQLELPHTVYLLQKRGMQQGDVQVGAAEFLPDSRQIVVEIINASGGLGRVAQVEVRADRERAVQPGFPLMPRSRRKVQFDWKAGVPPQTVIVHLKDFRVESPFQEQSK